MEDIQSYRRLVVSWVYPERAEGNQGWNPVFQAEFDPWIPACAGMTIKKKVILNRIYPGLLKNYSANANSFFLLFFWYSSCHKPVN